MESLRHRHKHNSNNNNASPHRQPSLVVTTETTIEIGHRENATTETTGSGHVREKESVTRTNRPATAIEGKLSHLSKEYPTNVHSTDLTAARNTQASPSTATARAHPNGVGNTTTKAEAARDATRVHVAIIISSSNSSIRKFKSKNYFTSSIAATFSLTTFIKLCYIYANLSRSLC